MLPHSTWQRFVAAPPSCCNRDNTTLHHPTSPDSESFVGIGWRVNEEQIENWASVFLWSTTNTEPASQVISLGCSWPSGVIKAVHHSSHQPAAPTLDNDCTAGAKTRRLDGFLTRAWLPQMHRGSLLSPLHWCSSPRESSRHMTDEQYNVGDRKGGQWRCEPPLCLRHKRGNCSCIVWTGRAADSCDKSPCDTFQSGDFIHGRNLVRGCVCFTDEAVKEWRECSWSYWEELVTQVVLAWVRLSAMKSNRRDC